MQPEIKVEELLWHDCPVDAITLDARTQTLVLLLDPSEEMLEALGMEYPQTSGFEVTFAGIDNLRTSYSFTFFEELKDLWAEVLHADFEKISGNSCVLGAIFYRGVLQQGYGEIAFRYDNALLDQIDRKTQP